MINFIKNKIGIIIICMICIIVIIGVLAFRIYATKVTSGNGTKNSLQINGYNIAALLENKTPYVGDNSKVVHLINNMPLANLRREVSLQTGNKPYEISVKYDFTSSKLSTQTIEKTFRNNATVLFALIDNVDVINFDMNLAKSAQKYQYTRAQLQQGFSQDLRKYSKDESALSMLLNSFKLNLFAYPEKYVQTMSSTPGIRISAQYDGTADKVQYSTESGELLTWDNKTGKVNIFIQKVELSLSTPVYWSPGTIKNIEKSTVKVSVLNKNTPVAEKLVNINFDGKAYYTVDTSTGVVISQDIPTQSSAAKTVDAAVSNAIKNQNRLYEAGEFTTEGHIILDTEEKDGITKAYTISSLGVFGFENGIFTIVSGSGAIATVMTFSKNENGDYSLLEYKEPKDGSYNLKSKKEMFPQRLWSKVLSEQKYYPDLAKQEEDQAKQYLKSIGRNAKVSSTYVERKLPNINVEASNKLFSEFMKYDSELNNFPYWLGTKESLQNGVRYIYETSQSKTSDGYDLITFKKTKEDGSVVSERKYKIVGTEPQLIGDSSVNTKK